MRMKGTNGFLWQGFVVAIGLVALACAARLWPLQDLGVRVTYTTFYPAVMVAALYGGLSTGLLAIIFSCLAVLFAWPAFAGEPIIKDFADWLGMAVFLFNCTVISGIIEGMRRSRSRARQMQLDLERSNAELQAARDNLEDEVKLRTTELTQANISLERELTERKHAEEELKNSEVRLGRSQAMAHLGSWELDVAKDILTWSDEVYRIFGLRPQQFKATYGAFLEAVHPDDRKAVDEAYSGSLREGRDTYEIEHRVIRKSDGEVRIVHEKCEHVRDQSGRIVRSVGMVHDITERKRHEYEKELTIGFLRLVNESRESADFIREATAFFQKHSGCDAVGIRLRDGDDYPYFEAQGFPEEFILLENRLCDYDKNGHVRRDSAGDPVLECMCGNVIRGRFDSSKPFFTARGSFWTNSTTDLLAGTTEEGRQAGTRNHCNREGYESVALVALRTGEETWGLLQLNDLRKGRFSPEIIGLWERLGQHLAVALAKFKAEEELREAKETLESRVKERTVELEAAKESLTAERQRLYQVLETLPVMVCLLTPDYHIAFANRSLREKFGEDNGQRCFDYIFGLKEPCEFCETYSVLKTGKPHHWECTSPDGSIFDMYDFPFSDTDGSPLILRMNIDITEHRRAQEEVKAERQRLYDVLDTLPVYVCLLDSDYKMPFANRYFRETFGESLGRRCYEFLFNRSEPCEICETYTVMKTRALHQWYWTGPNGRNYDVYDFPFIDRDGSFLILEMGIDITERKQAEDALKQTLVDLTRSNADLEKFAYVASHDLQEPLRNVAGCLQLLEQKYRNKLDADADQYIQYAVEGAVRMRALIQDLLTYSRIGTRGKPPEQIDCEQILEQTVKNLSSAISEAGAVITHDPLPTILADGTQLSEVFQNLIQNSIKFRQEEPPKIHISASKNEDEWIFSVKDNGIGIESQYFDRIFEIFQRLNKREQYDGTGMGLAIVKKVLERHRGRVWVESEPGKGTTFYFTILAKGVQT